MLFLLLNLLLFGSAFAAVGWNLLRAPGAPVAKAPLRAAGRIGRLVDVPLVTFGHTHDEEIARLVRPGGPAGWYFNTGTWIAIFGYDELMPRERVQYTFLRVRGHQGELLAWSPGRREAVSVVLLADDRSHPVSDAEAR